jgi:hypothetical protein
MTSWLLLGLLTVVGAGAAVLGVVQSPKTAPLYICTPPQQHVNCTGAVPNTLAASNYSEVLTENTSQGTQTDYLVYQAPDRLGGYIQSGNKRTYVVVIGTVVYQSLTVTPDTPTSHLTFYRQQSQGAKTLDPVHGYLPYVSQGKTITRSGDTYSFTLTRTVRTATGKTAKQTAALSYTVSGQYVSEFSLTVKNAAVNLVISQVGSSPPVALPAGAKVIGANSGAGSTPPG